MGARHFINSKVAYCNLLNPFKDVTWVNYFQWTAKGNYLAEL